MKLIYCFMIFLWPFVSTGQKIKPLTIGDTVPDITISNVYNYPDSSIHLSDLKGKVVILDFWATFCSSCIGTFPEMGKLKKEFGDKLQIIMVNSYYPDTIQKVRAFFKRREKNTGLTFQLTFALEDSILRDMFPYKQIPHDVWINKKGIVSAITSSDEVTGDNLAVFLKNDQITLPVKNDNLLFNIDKPLLIDENSGSDPGFLYRSVITGYKKNLGSVLGQRMNEEGKIKRLFVINYPLLTLFQMAYKQVSNLSINRLLIEAPDEIKKAILNRDSVTYCYEIITAPSTEREIQKYMQEDLYRAFHLKASKEIRNITCYIIKPNKNIKNSISKGGIPAMEIGSASIRKYIHNMPVSDLRDLVEILTNKPVINETNIRSHIDIEIPQDIYSYSFEKISKFLNSKGFDLIEAKRPLEAIVISEK